MSCKEVACGRPDCQWVKVTTKVNVYFCLRCLREQEACEPEEEEKPESIVPLIVILVTIGLLVSLIAGPQKPRHYPTMHRNNYGSVQQ